MKQEEFKIRKGIPRPSKGSNRIYPWREMSVGDSFIYGEYSRKGMTKASNCARNWVSKSNDCTDWKFSCRKTEDNKIGIWRIQ